MDALEYFTALRLTPSGELLSSTEKLALLLLALGCDERGEIIPEIDRLAERSLVNRRSMFRVLGELERKGCLIPVPQFTPTGQSAPTLYRLIDALGQSVTGNTPTAGRVLPVTPESVIRRGQSVTRNTLPAPFVSNSLQPSSNGTSLAIPPSVNNNTGGGLFDAANPSVAAWLEIIGQPYGVPLTPEGAAEVAAHVFNVEAWRATLKGWLASGWNKTNIDGQIERYATKTLKRPEYAAQGNAPSLPPTVEKRETEEDARHRQLIYGDQNG